MTGQSQVARQPSCLRGSVPAKASLYLGNTYKNLRLVLSANAISHVAATVKSSAARAMKIDLLAPPKMEAESSSNHPFSGSNLFFVSGEGILIVYLLGDHNLAI